jgi:cupin 2 domain-containing protein
VTTVRPARAGDEDDVLRMRRVLYPDCPDPEHHEEIAAFVAGRADAALLVAEREDGGLAGLAEVGLRSAAEGCHAPTDVGIGYLEGWWVDADRRRLGVGRALVRACEDWARAAGCVELASDAKLDNVAGHLAHRAVGFEETERLVAFRKALGPPAPAAAAPARGGHIADGIPAALPEELVTVLVAGAGARAERIVSRGHASPPGFWYDQPEDEWVIVLSGAARLEIEGAGGIEPVELRAGSFVELPRHTRHRVAWTDPAVNTIWLALFRG